MNRSQLLRLIDKKIDSIFFQYQDSNGIKYGDIDPFDALLLDKIKKELAGIVERTGSM